MARVRPQAPRLCGSTAPSTCLLPDLLVLGEAGDHLHVLVGQLAHGHLVVLLGHVVGKDDGGKDREAVGGVESPIVVVVVAAGQLLGEAERSGGQTGAGPTLPLPRATGPRELNLAEVWHPAAAPQQKLRPATESCPLPGHSTHTSSLGPRHSQSRRLACSCPPGLRGGWRPWSGAAGPLPLCRDSPGSGCAGSSGRWSARDRHGLRGRPARGRRPRSEHQLLSPDWTAAPGGECSLLLSLVMRRHRTREGREPQAPAPHPTSAPAAHPLDASLRRHKSPLWALQLTPRVQPREPGCSTA